MWRTSRCGEIFRWEGITFSCPDFEVFSLKFSWKSSLPFRSGFTFHSGDHNWSWLDFTQFTPWSLLSSYQKTSSKEQCECQFCLEIDWNVYKRVKIGKGCNAHHNHHQHSRHHHHHHSHCHHQQQNHLHHHQHHHQDHHLYAMCKVHFRVVMGNAGPARLCGDLQNTT